jgi:hypothetical protein
MTQAVHNGFPLDAYQTAKLQQKFVELVTAQDRIDFMERLEQGQGVPFEVADAAVRDPSSAVRSWAAANLELDYRMYIGREEPSVRPSQGERESVAFEQRIDALLGRPRYRFPDRNLFAVVEADPDPLVRASLCENQSFPIEEKLAGLNQLQKLAAMRRLNLSAAIVTKVFDPNDKTLNVSLEERCELATAFLCKRANSTLARNLDKSYSDAEFRVCAPLELANTAAGDLSNLWPMALDWPDSWGIPTLVFKLINADDDTMASTYRQCERPEWRYAMLTNQHHYEQWHVTHCDVLRLAVEDSDPAVRSRAYELLNLRVKDNNPVAEEAVQRVLRNGSQPEIRSILRNPTLPSKLRKEIVGQYRALAQKEEVGLAKTLWEQTRHPRPSLGELVKWSDEERFADLWTLVSELRTAVGTLHWVRFIGMLGAIAGLVLGVPVYLLTMNLPASLLIWSLSVLIGVILGEATASRDRIIPPWMTIEEAAHLWAPFDRLAERISESAKRKLTRELDFFDDPMQSDGASAAKKIAFDLCLKARTDEERKCYRDYIEALLDNGGTEALDSVFAHRSSR